MNLAGDRELGDHGGSGTLHGLAGLHALVSGVGGNECDLVALPVARDVRHVGGTGGLEARLRAGGLSIYLECDRRGVAGLVIRLDLQAVARAGAGLHGEVVNYGQGGRLRLDGLDLVHFAGGLTVGAGGHQHHLVRSVLALKVDRGGPAGFEILGDLGAVNHDRG